MDVDPTKHDQNENWQAFHAWRTLQDALQAEVEARNAFLGLAGDQGQLEAKVDEAMDLHRVAAFEALRPKIDAMVKASGIHDGYNDEVISNFGVESTAAKFRGSQQGGVRYQSAEQQVNAQIKGVMEQRHAAMGAKHSVMEKRHEDMLNDRLALSVAQAVDMDREARDIKSEKSQYYFEKHLMSFRIEDRANDLKAEAAALANGAASVVKSVAIASPELIDKLLDKPVSEAFDQLGRDKFGHPRSDGAAEPASQSEFFNLADEKEKKVFAGKILPYAKAAGQKREIVAGRNAWNASQRRVAAAQRGLVEHMKLGGQERLASEQEKEQVLKFASLDPAKANDLAELAAAAKVQSFSSLQLLDSASPRIAQPIKEFQAAQEASAHTPSVPAMAAPVALLPTAQDMAAQQHVPAAGQVPGLATKGFHGINSTVARQAETQERLKFFEKSGLGGHSSAAALEDGMARFDAHWLVNGQELTKQLEAKQVAAAAAKLAAQSQSQTNGLGIETSKPRGRGM